MAFYFDPKEQRYIILHNFSNRFFYDDAFANTISNILYRGLDEQNVTNYDFYEDKVALSILSREYKEEISDKKEQNLFVNMNENQLTINPNKRGVANSKGIDASKLQLSA